MSRFASRLSVAASAPSLSLSEPNPVIARHFAIRSQAHGDIVKGEFPSLDAIAAVVHCEDLSTLPTFDSVASVSLNGPIAVQDLASDAEAAVLAARTSLVAAKADALAAQQAVRSAEKAAALANAQVTTAKRALVIANRLTGLAKTLAVAAAQAQVAAAEAAADVKQSALEAARTNATALAGRGAQRAERVGRGTGSPSGGVIRHCDSRARRQRRALAEEEVLRDHACPGIESSHRR